MSRRTSKRRLSAAPRRVLGLPWRRWLAENLARGVDPGELARILADQGVPAGEAAIRLAEAGAGAAVARADRRRADRAEAVLRLFAALRPPTIERREALDADEFFARYWATNTPVIITDLVRRWPAFTRWSPGYLRERFGAVEIEAEIGRAVDPEPDLHFAAHRRSITLGEYVDRVVAAGESNDLYLIARNHNLARSGLRALLEDLSLPPGYFDQARIAANAALWFGPAGTVTRLHHDCSNILFAQVVGRKRVRLGAPEEPVLLAHARGVYSDYDPEAPPSGAAAHLFDLALEAGEALFIPVGWWHHVRALDLSLSVALNAFTRANNFEWHKPGSGS